MKKISFYTDGSLYEKEEAEMQVTQMGAGWVAITEHKKENEKKKAGFSYALKEWPSSTRAELRAIWTASLVAPEDTEVMIYTDSLAAIQALKSKNGKEKEREAFKLKNATLLR